MNTLKNKGHYGIACFWCNDTYTKILLEKNGFECGPKFPLDGCRNIVGMKYRKAGTFKGFDFYKSLELLSKLGFSQVT